LKQKVILIGGFSGSPSLRGYLKQALALYDDGSIELVTPKEESVA